MTADLGSSRPGARSELDVVPTVFSENFAVDARVEAQPSPVPAVGATELPPATEERARRRVERLRRAFWVPAMLLLAVDVAAFAAATLLTGTAQPKGLVLLLLVVALYQHAGLYRSRLTFSILNDMPTLVGRGIAAGAVVMVLGGLEDGRAGTARLGTAVIFVVLSVLGRALVYHGIRVARHRHHLQQRTLLLGAGQVAGTLAENLLEHPEYGLHPAGFVEDDPLLGEGERPVPVLGRYEDLTRVLVDHQIDMVIVTYGSVRDPSMVSLLRACDRLDCEIYFVPRLYELHVATKDTEVLWGVPLIRLRRAPFRTRAWTGKRIFDAAVSGLALLLVSPAMLVCAAMARYETGTAIFRQQRIGLDGRPFEILKFCSLRPAAATESTTKWNIAEDGRVGPFGRFLRRSSLDELPQLWNVLRGDMSLVGPRPERPFFVDEFARRYPWYTARHRVPAGLTGWAQVHGLRGDTSIADRAKFDNFYIENWSMWGDIKILLRTVGKVLGAAGR
ncbi:sugar transferase [Blastococcus sp. TBT05-19]|uniref:sugar transferase n=1 Tax=Blastococcus sp. TBT05-19 TaxID=2250581 RepID=UPI000DE82A7F|nr:sugar transferase [Blastococcus sp. TBT05-19]RBY93948.1 sugar transferase [Blastococcus sp. TBT05-19]